MKLDLTLVLKDIDGKDMVDSIAIARCGQCGNNVVFPRIPAGESKPLTLKRICVLSLYRNASARDQITPEQMYERHKLAKRIGETDEVELSVEECVLLKRAVGEAQGTLIVGQVWDMIEGCEGG